MADDLEPLSNIIAARDGSPDALGQALESCRLYLLMIAENELSPGIRAKGGASDLVQQTFMEAQRDFNQFAGQTNQEWRAWLRRLLLNNIANFHRHYQQTAKRQIQQEIPLQAGDSAAPESDWLPGDCPTPSRELIQRENETALDRALKQLPEDYRTVLLLRYQEELPFEEIGARMQRTSNAVRKLWSRAIEKLQELMEQHP